MKVAKFEDLDIWKEARDLCKEIRIYSNREVFCKDYRLKDQIHGSSGSVMDNIAEGFEREGTKEFIQFLSIAKGSCAEVRSQSYRSFDCHYISKEELECLLSKTETISLKINNFIDYLKKCDFAGTKYKTN